MERIIVENVSKQFMIGFKKKKRSLTRIIDFILGRESTKKILAVNNVSFKANEGEIIGLIGKNGSGKSTLLRLIAGIYQKNKGNIKTNGNIVSLVNLHVGLKERLTMRDNIYLIGSLFGLGQKDIKKKFDDIIKFAELEEFVDTKVSQFSAGMTQRLVFSVAINSNPEILLLDEVFEVGDENFKKKSEKKIKELVTNKATVILVSHEMKIIEKHCNRVICMDKGKIVDIGEPKKIVKEYIGSFN